MVSAQWLGVLASYSMKSTANNRGVKCYNNMNTPVTGTYTTHSSVDWPGLNLYVNMSIDWKWPLSVNMQLYVIFLVISWEVKTKNSFKSVIKLKIAILNKNLLKH